MWHSLHFHWAFLCRRPEVPEKWRPRRTSCQTMATISMYISKLPPLPSGGITLTWVFHTRPKLLMPTVEAGSVTSLINTPPILDHFPAPSSSFSHQFFALWCLSWDQLLMESILRQCPLQKSINLGQGTLSCKTFFSYCFQSPSFLLSLLFLLFSGFLSLTFFSSPFSLFLFFHALKWQLTYLIANPVLLLKPNGYCYRAGS